MCAGCKEVKCEGNFLVFLRLVKPSANLGVVILVVSRAARNFDLSYVGMFSPVC